MIGLLGYNFCSDGNALDPMPTSVNNITTTTIQNGTYDHFYAGYDVTSEYSHTLPTAWDFNTIMDCNFENNISAGNIDDLTSNISGVKIKRREKGTFDWTTIKEIAVTSIDDLSFIFTDN